MKGILAALAALVVAGLQQRQGQPPPGAGGGAPPSGPGEPIAGPGPDQGYMPGPGEPIAGPDQGYMPGPGPSTTPLPDVFRLPSGGTSPAGEQIAVNVGIIETIPATIAEAIPDPLNMTSRVVIESKPATWQWYTPGGTITSRQPITEEEAELGCPEVEGIWEYPLVNQQNVRYCANMECPSNKREYDYTSHEWLEPTPAQLEQQVDAAGNISYFCRVCRTYQ